jgi:hypothetical protein
MLLVRTGGIFGVIVSLIVAAIFFFVVRPAINDTTDRAFDHADRAMQRAEQQSREMTRDIQSSVDKQLDQANTTVEQATKTVEEATNGDFMTPAAYGDIVHQIKAKIGDDAEILDFSINPLGGNVKYRNGNRAAGYQFGTGFDGLQPVKVTLVGSGKLSDNVFPISKLEDGAVAKIVKGIKSNAGAGYDIKAMTLGIAPVTGNVQWTISGEGKGRLSTYTAQVDGSGVKKLA